MRLPGTCRSASEWLRNEILISVKTDNQDHIQEIGKPLDQLDELPLEIKTPFQTQTIMSPFQYYIRYLRFDDRYAKCLGNAIRPGGSQCPGLYAEQLNGLT